MVPFRVIIVGGSVAGLALANMLEQYGIDFVVLEKHESIAPHIGAGFAMLPHGARILDQLGCYNALEKLSTPIDTMAGYDENAERCTKISNIGVFLEKSLGYKMGFLERQQVVQGLFDNLRDKSKIHNSCCVSKIHLTDEQVTVETDSGVFEGDLVAGADGVHSYVRREMARLASADGDESFFHGQKEFECCYSAMFGTSVAPEGLIENQAFKGFKSDRSFLCSPGKGGLLYWIAMFKNGEKTSGDGIPRYTRDDCDRLAANFADDIIKPGVRLGDMYRDARKATLVPLEQGVLSTCFYKRIVLVGDSWHKINPITGQGGNTAIAGAAYLTDGLMDLLDREERPTQASIEKLFSDYQQHRGPISRTLSENAHIMQRMEALETPILKFFQLNVIKFLPLKFIRRKLLTTFNTGLLLKRLPPPSRSGTVHVGPQTQKAPSITLSFLVKLWIIFLIPMTVVYYSLA
ncbi:unnamed protein product [Penicillium salamii]|uniref:FAD-binding domain-containing protein n=1 Tax=Penicillium salamii TaxID=1612424 RepID=A0A9W4NBK1_9EURO|nr:unnamed protein product [Penicillium salamii]